MGHKKHKNPQKTGGFQALEMFPIIGNFFGPFFQPLETFWRVFPSVGNFSLPVVLAAFVTCIGVVNSWAVYCPGELEGWDFNDAMTQDTSFGNIYKRTLSASSDDASSEYKFTYDAAWDDWNQFANTGTGTVASVNSSIGNAGRGGGHAGAGIPGSYTFNQSNGKYYSFNVRGGNWDNYWAYVVMETSADPISITSCSDNSASRYTNSVTVSFGLSGSKSSEESLWVRYTDDSWSTSHLTAEATGSGTNYSAVIPAKGAGTTVNYYILSSTMPSNQIVSDPDLCTLKGLADDYSYTFPNPNYGMRDDAGANLPTLTYWYTGQGSDVTEKGSEFNENDLGTVEDVYYKYVTNKVWKTSGGDVTNTVFKYKVWEQGDSEPASYTERSVGYSSQSIDGSTTNQVWASFGAEIHVIDDDSQGAGTYNLKILFEVQGTGTAGKTTDGPYTATCTIAASTEPGIGYAPSSLSVSSTLGEEPAASSLWVTNVGGGTLSYTVSDDVDWLSVSDGSGSLASGVGKQHTATYSKVAGMEAGTSNATITISDANATNSPQTIAVQWTIGGLSNPTDLSASLDDGGNTATRADLSWTEWDNRNVLITRATASPSGSPTQGTGYSPGNTFGNQTVIVGSQDNGALEVTGLTPGETYYFRFYSENYSYYSSGDNAASLTMGMPKAQNTGGAGTPEEPATVYLGDTGLTSFGLDVWGSIEAQTASAKLFIDTDSNVSDGSSGAATTTRTGNNMTPASPQFTSTGTWYWGVQMTYGTYGNNFWYKSSEATWANMSFDGSGSTLSVTVSALNDPGSQTATKNGSNPTSQIDLTWALNAQSHSVMIVRKTSAESWTEPTQGTSYTAGSSTIGDGDVIYIGDGTSHPDSGLSAGTTYDYKFYSVNNNYYSAGVTAQASTDADSDTATKEPFVYTADTALEGDGGGSGWSGNWTSVANGGSYTNRATSLTAPTTYPATSGGKVSVTTVADTEYKIRRDFGDVSSGSIFVAGLVQYQYRGTNKWVGISLMSNGNERAYFGKLASRTNLGMFSYGTAEGGSTFMPSAYVLNATEDVADANYLIIAKYDFSSRVLKTKAYWKTDTLPTQEPNTWDASVTLAEGRINSLDGVMLNCGGSDGNYPGTVSYDEIRVATNGWYELLGQDPPPTMIVLGEDYSEIADGAASPSSAVGTDFGEVATNGATSATSTLLITNSGPGSLDIESISITGDGASDFSVSQSAPFSITENTASNLTVTFDPTVIGTRQAWIELANNSLDTDPYDFLVQGVGTGTTSAITVDGDPSDWVGTAGAVTNSALFAGSEYIWNDQLNEARQDPGAGEDYESNMDIDEFRVTADSTNIYILVKMRDITDVTYPAVGIGLTTNMQPADSGMIWLGADSDLAIGGGYYSNNMAQMHYGLRNIMIHTVSGTAKVELYAADSDSWYEAPNGWAASFSAANNVLEVYINRADLLLAGDVTSRWTVATFQGTDQACSTGNATYDFDYNDAIDTISIAPYDMNDQSITLTSWQQGPLGENKQDFFFDIPLDGDGMNAPAVASAPSLTSPANAASVEGGSPELQWLAPASSTLPITSYMIEMHTNTLTGTYNGNIPYRYNVTHDTLSKKLETVEQTLYWRVWARDSSGMLSSPSDVRYWTASGDSDENGPVPNLVYVGTNVNGYLAGTVDGKNSVLDSDLVNGAVDMDFAVELFDGSGVYYSNSVDYTQLNIFSGNGRVIPNWDIMESNKTTGATTEWAHDDAFAVTNVVAPDGYGSTYITCFWHSAFTITNYNTNIVYFLTVSSEDCDANGTWAAPSANYDGANSDRSIATNALTQIVVTDDDDVEPRMGTGGFQLYKGSGRAEITPVDNVYTMRLDELTAVDADDPLRFVFNAYDTFSGLQVASSGTASTNTRLAVANWITNNIAGYDADESDATTTGVGATNTWKFTSLDAESISNMFEQGASGNAINLAMIDADHDRNNDQKAANSQTEWKLEVTMPQSQNKSGFTPADIYLGDTGVTFEADTRIMGPNADKARVWTRYDNADVEGGTAGNWSAGIATEAKSAGSGQFTQTGTWYWGMQIDSIDYGTSFWYTTSQAEWAEMSTDGTGGDQTVTVNALGAPSAVSAAVNGTDIDLTWTEWATRPKAIVVWNMTNAPSAPADGTHYSAADSVGSDGTKVVYVGDAGLDTHTPTAIDGYANCYAVYTENHGYYSASGLTTNVIVNPLWIGDASAVWSTDGNWTCPDYPPEAQRAVFYKTRSSGQTLSLDAARVNYGLLFNDTATDAITINNGGSGSVSLGAGGIDITSGSAAGHTLNVPVEMSAEQDWDVAKDFTMGGVLSDDVSVAWTKSGAGTLTLGGNNTFDGQLTISDGVVRITHTNGLGDVVAGTVVASGAALELNVGNNYPAEALTLSGTGISGGGALRKVNTGTQTFPGNITLGADARVNADGGTLTLTGSADLDSGTLYIGGSGNVAFGTTDQLANAGKTTDDGAIYKDGSGTLSLRPNAALLGDVRITAGMLQLDIASGTLPSGGTLYMSNGVTIRSSSDAGRNIAKNTELSGNVTFGTSASGTGSGTLDFQGSFNLGSAVRTLTMPATNQISGVISAGGITKAGDGLLILSGDNDYTGGTTISAGRLQVGAGGTSGIVSNNIANNGALAFDRSDAYTYDNVISGTGWMEQQGSGTLTLSGENTYSGGTLVSAGTLEGTTTSLQGFITNKSAVIFDQAGDGEYSDVMAGTGTLNKQGTGDVTLSGANTYSGATTVEAGTLKISNDAGLGTAAAGTTVSDGATLAVQDGTTSADVLDINGSGDSSVGAINSVSGANELSGNVTLSGAAEVQVDADALTMSGVINSGGVGRNLTKTGNGTLVLSGLNTFVGELCIQQGKVAVASVSATRNANQPLGAAESTRDVYFGATSSTGMLRYTGATAESAKYFGVVPGGTGGFEVVESDTVLTISGTIRDGSTSSTLIKEGAGTAVFSSSANVYQGLTRVAAGGLRATDANSLGAGGGSDSQATRVQDGAALELSGGFTLDERMYLSGAGIGSGGALRNASGVNTVSQDIYLEANSSIGVDADSLTLNDVISGTYNLTKVGAEKLVLTADNSFSGKMIVEEGTLEIDEWKTGATTDQPLGTSSAADALTLGSDGEEVTLRYTEIPSNVGRDKPVTLASGGTGVFEIVEATAELSLSGAISGAGAFRKSGAGTQCLESATSSYTGESFVDQGTLQVETAAGMGVTKQTTVADGAVLQLAPSGSATFWLGSNVVLNGGGVAGNGVLRNVTGENTLRSDLKLNADSTIGVDANFLDVTNHVWGSGDLIKVGAGELRMGTNAHTYTGATMISNGIVRISQDESLGTAPGGVTAGHLTINGGDLRKSESSGDFTLSANRGLTIGANHGTISPAGFVIAYDGVLLGPGNLTKALAGTLSLGGDNSAYDGVFTVSGGILRATHNNALGGTVTNTIVQAGATLGFSGNVTVGEPVSIASTGTTTRTGIYTVSGSNQLSGTVTFTAGTSVGASTGNVLTLSGATITGDTFDLTADQPGDVYISSAINTTSGKVIKNGSGTLTLSGTSGYAGGTIINAGTLSISADRNVGAVPAAQDVDNLYLDGGTLGASATFALDVDRGVTLESDSTFTVPDGGHTMTINGPIAGGASDTLIKTGAGTLTLAGTNNYGDNTVSAGTLRGTTYSIDGTINNSASVVFDQDTDGTFASQIDGTGTLTKEGSGTVTLSSSSSDYTGQTYINEGYLKISSDVRLGAVPGVVSADQLTMNGGGLHVYTDAITIPENRGITLSAGGGLFYLDGGIPDANETIVQSVVSGTGGLTLEVGGLTGDREALRLEKDATYEGDTTVTSGRLYMKSIDNSGTLTVGADGLFNATGTVGAVSISGTVDMTARVGKGANPEVGELNCSELDLNDGATIVVSATSGASASNSMIRVAGDMILPDPSEQITVDLSFMGDSTNYFRNIPFVYYSGTNGATPHTNWVVTGVPTALQPFMVVKHKYTGSGEYYVQGATPYTDITNGMQDASEALEVKIQADTVEDVDYDLIYFDAINYPSGSGAATANWQKLYSVTASGSSTTFTNNLVNLNAGYLRFLRISPMGAWQNESGKFASRQIYVAKKAILYPGRNWVSLPGVPMNPTVSNVFGYGLPAGASPSAAIMYLYDQGDASISVTGTIRLATASSWVWDSGGTGSASDFELPFDQGFVVDIPTTASAQYLALAGALRTNTQSISIGGAGTLTFVSVVLPRAMAPGDLGLTDDGFTGGARAMRSDRLYVWDRVNQRIANNRWMWYKTGVGWYWDNGVAVSGTPISQDDALVIYTVNDPGYTWDSDIYYTPPTSDMDP
jgi:autotransporter-associated beta strand protein